MKKIGILTFHRASNYGAVLQAYALQNKLTSLGAEVEIIDYRCPAVESAHNPKDFIRTHSVKSWLRVPGKLKKYNVFNMFRRNYLHLSDRASSANIDEIEQKYDILIAGSDQLWNDRFSGMDIQYFMPGDSKAYKYTYAISIGDRFNSDLLADSLKTYGTSIRSISLREESGLQFIKNITDIPCRVDVDPTLLLSVKEWSRIIKRPMKKKPYILVYTIAEPDLLIKKAKEYSLETGYELLYLNSSFSKNIGVKKIRYSSPQEFIGWFADAQFVFTNSFHGTAFSIILNKPFAIEERSDRGLNRRSLDLIERLEIGSRSIKTDLKISDMPTIKWEEVNKRIKEYVGASEEYLTSIVDSV